MCICTNMLSHTHIHVYVYTYIYIYTHKFVYISTSMYTCACVHIYIYIYMCMNVYMAIYGSSRPLHSGASLAEPEARGSAPPRGAGTRASSRPQTPSVDILRAHGTKSVKKTTSFQGSYSAPLKGFGFDMRKIQRWYNPENYLTILVFP